MKISVDIKRRIHQDLERSNEVLVICERIVDFLESEDPEQLKHLSFGHLASISKAPQTELFTAIQYLTGTIELLVPMFEFIDDDDIFLIEPSDIQEARKDGEFYHPITGELVVDFESHVFMHFVPSGLDES